MIATGPNFAFKHADLTGYGARMYLSDLTDFQTERPTA